MTVVFAGSQRAAAANALFASLEEKYVGKSKGKKKKVGKRIFFPCSKVHFKQPNYDGFSQSDGPSEEEFQAIQNRIMKGKENLTRPQETEAPPVGPSGIKSKRKAGK